MAKNEFRLPAALEDGKEQEAAALLKKYYGSRYAVVTEISAYKVPLTGAWFDDFDPSGTRGTSPDVVTADDLLSLSLLSTPVNGNAVHAILGPLSSKITALLEQIPVDETLASHHDEVTADNFPAWRLENLLREIHGIGLTYASKLIARKRPRLYPILDSVICEQLGGGGVYLEPLRREFRDENLLQFLRTARDAAGLPESISDLRIFDVVTWMHGKNHGSADPAEFEAPPEAD